MILLRVSLIFPSLVSATRLVHIQDVSDQPAPQEMETGLLAAYCFAVAYSGHLPDWSRHLTWIFRTLPDCSPVRNHNLIPKTVFMLTSILLKLFRRLINVYSSRMDQPSTCTAHLWVCIVQTIKGKENFQVKEVTFYSPDLRTHSTDTASCNCRTFVQKLEGERKGTSEAIDLCNRQNADLAVFTGDLVNSRADELLEFMPVFAQLKARDGVYSVLGNHDYGSLRKMGKMTGPSG